MAIYQARTNQGGSVAPFIIGAVILLVVAVGAMFFLHKRTSIDPTISPVVSNSPSVSVPPSTTSDQSSSPSPTKTPSVRPSASPQPTQSTQPSSQPQLVTGESALPATGPSDLMPAGIVIAILVAFAVSYTRSLMDRATARHNR